MAWQIALGTFLFGDTEFGVCFTALLFSFFLPLATYRLAKQCQLHEKGAFYAALAIAFCPVGLMASFAATTDGGFVLFFTLAFAALLYPNWLLFGLFLYELVSFFQKMQANWAIYVYPIASVLVAWVCLERKKLFYSCVYTSIILTLILMNSIAFLPSKINLFKPTLGWNSLPDALEMAGYQPDQHFLFADNYQMTSILSFYSPGQKQAYFLNLPGHRKNQFSFWPQMAQEQLHATGYFVTDSQNFPAYFEQKLAPYFAKVHYLGTFPLYQAEKEVKIFKTEDYNGKAPQDPGKY